MTTPPPPPPPDAPPPPPGPTPGAPPEWYRQPGLLAFLGVVAAGIAGIILVVVLSGDDGAGPGTTIAATTSTAPSTTTTLTPSTTTTSQPPTTTSTSTTTTSTTTTSTTTTTTTQPTTTTETPTTSLPPGDPYPEYVEVTDDSGRITLEVPVAWSDTLGSPWERDGEEIGVALSASPDRDAFYDSWGMPGVFIGASSLMGTITEYLDSNLFDASCTYAGRSDYEDPLYTGLLDTWVDCGDEGSVFEILAVVSADGLELIVVEVISVTQADLEAAQRIHDTFVVQGA